MINSPIKFDKIEVLVKNVVNDVVLPSTTKIEFNNCGLNITGEYMIISVEERTGDNYKINTTVTNRIYNLSDVVAYKTFLLKLNI
jgi:hypothetical protein